MTRHIKTKDVDKEMYFVFMKKAEENTDSAENSLKSGRYNAAAVSAVHGAISAADALCAFSLAKRSASETHKDAAALIMMTKFSKETNVRIAKLFESIISIKNMAEYEQRLVKPKDAEIAVREAVDLLSAVKAAIRI
jgi:uncharacterized protein (UPF0332 family)